MFRQAVRRALALLLALCLLPAAALGQAASPAEEWPVDSSAVTRADFDLSVQLHADAFPADGLTDYQGWETLLSKLRLSGVMDLQRFPRPNNRMYMEAQILLNDRELTHFSLEDYWGFRYVRSPALCNRSIHFQMDNYLEFMLKPYDYYELPTQYISLLTYPEVTAYLAESYEDVLTPYFHGEGSRTISYDDLYQLCQDMDAVMTEARAEQSYFFLLSLLIDLGMADQVYDGLSCLEDYLDWLDPEQEGMTITVEGDTDRYEVGGRTLFTRTRGEGELTFRLSLPTENDEELTLEYDQTPGANGGMDVNARLTVSVQEETRPSERDGHAIDRHAELCRFRQRGGGSRLCVPFPADPFRRPAALPCDLRRGLAASRNGKARRYPSVQRRCGNEGRKRAGGSNLR